MRWPLVSSGLTRAIPDRRATDATGVRSRDDLQPCWLVTLGAIWLNDEQPESPRLWMATDSRISDEVGSLIDEGIKLYELGTMHGALLACGIRCSWERVEADGLVECWECETGRERLRVELRDRPRAGPLVTVRRDLGSGFRRVRQEEPPSLPTARQRVYTLLRRAVQGRAL